MLNFFGVLSRVQVQTLGGPAVAALANTNHWVCCTGMGEITAETRALRELAKFLIQAIGHIASNSPWH